MEPTKTIKIASLNYYECKFPNRKLVNIDKLKLIKTLRQNGYEVIVLPNDGKPFNYVFTKGISEFLLDPIHAYIVNAETTVFLGLLVNYITQIFSKPTPLSVTNNITNIIVHQSGTNSKIDITGKEISDENLKLINNEVDEKKLLFEKCFKQCSPYPNLSTPIFLNHQPEIVGWCRMTYDEIGLKVEDGIITHGAVRNGIDNGLYKGFSVAGIAEYSKCSICSENYVDCNHISGMIYDNKQCVNEIIKSTGIEVSIVNEPTNALCLLELK